VAQACLNHIASALHCGMIVAQHLSVKQQRCTPCGLLSFWINKVPARDTQNFIFFSCMIQ
jgi:hypothetical protein